MRWRAGFLTKRLTIEDMKELVQKAYQARNLNKEYAMDRGRWKKLIKIG